MSDTVKHHLHLKLSCSLVGAVAHERMSPSHRQPPGMEAHADVPRKSAVMVLLYGELDSLSVLFIQRPEYDGHHGGQMAFPGGKMDLSDETLLDTSIRECYEEIGICVLPSDIIGELTPLHIPVSNMDVYSYIAYLPQLPLLSIDRREVSYTVSAPISALLQPETVCHKTSIINNTSVNIPYYKIEDHEIWGATAMITSELLAMLVG